MVKSLRWRSVGAPESTGARARTGRVLTAGHMDARIVVLLLAGFFDAISDNGLHGLVL